MANRSQGFLRIAEHIYALSQVIYLVPYIFWIGLGVGLLLRYVLAYEIAKGVALFVFTLLLMFSSTFWLANRYEETIQQCQI
ncbi:MAG: hypothetical protein PHG89_06835 [Gallionella sp.]|nr:hypothetical protein [Gallionella sp.]